MAGKEIAFFNPNIFILKHNTMTRWQRLGTYIWFKNCNIKMFAQALFINLARMFLFGKIKQLYMHSDITCGKEPEEQVKSWNKIKHEHDVVKRSAIICLYHVYMRRVDQNDFLIALDYIFIRFQI